MSTMDRSPSHSWWWDSHRNPKKPTKWLQSSIEDLDAMVKRMLDLIEEDADSFAKRAEMYYKKRPELVNMVEQFYRAYRSMAEKYDNLRGEIKQNVPRALQIRYGLLVAGQHRSLSMLAASDLHRTVSTASSTSAGDQADMFSPDCGASSSFSSTASDSEVDDPPPPEAPEAPEVSSSLQEENDFLRSRVDALEREASSLRDQIDRLKAMRRPEEDIVIIRSPSHQEDVQINRPEATPLERVFRTPSHQEHDIDEPEAASPLGREIRSPSHQEDLQIDEPDASPLEREFRLPSHQEYDIDELEAASPLEREIRSPLHQEDQIVEPKASPLEREFRSPSHQEYDGNELEAASPLENEIIRSPSHQEDQINQPEANLPKREFRSPLHQEYDTNELEAASVLEREIIIRPPSHQEDQIDEPKASLPKREIESSSHQEYQLDELNANLLETEIRSSSHQDHCLDNESAADVLEMVASNQAQIVKELPEKEIALALEESAAALLSANFLSADQSNGHNATWVDADFLPVLARFLVMRRGKNDSMIKSMELAASLDTPVHEILEHEEEGDAGDTNGLKTSAGAALRPDAAGLMRRKLSTLEAENQQQKALILEREEEKREAIRQLSYAMDMLKEENTRLERALVLTKMNIDSNNNNNNNNNNHNNNNNNHNNNNNNNNNSRNSKNAKASSSTNVTIVGNHGSMTALASTATTAREMSSWKQILAHALGRESFASVLLDI